MCPAWSRMRRHHGGVALSTAPSGSMTRGSEQPGGTISTMQVPCHVHMANCDLGCLVALPAGMIRVPGGAVGEEGFRHGELAADDRNHSSVEGAQATVPERQTDMTLRPGRLVSRM